MIGLWPFVPFAYPGTTSDAVKTLIFPSGRQAVTHALEMLGSRREWLVALPEYSGHCLVSAVAKSATPTPITLAIERPAAIDVMLLYCQWGWEKPTAALLEVSDFFPKAHLLLDRVDSLADSLYAMPWEDAGRDAVQIFSLSKTLGLAGGGLLFHRGTWVAHTSAPTAGCEQLAAILADLGAETGDDEIRSTVKVWSMADVSTLSLPLRRWLDENDLEAAIRQAAEARSARRQLVVDHLDEMGWPSWMAEQLMVEESRIPGLAPLFINSIADADALKTAVEVEVGIEVELYHFDRSVSYLRPDWAPCLAVPLHGNVSLDKLERIIDLWTASARSATP